MTRPGHEGTATAARLSSEPVLHPGRTKAKTTTLWNEIVARALPVARRRDLSPRQCVDEFLRTGLPVVIEGAIEDWPAFRKWTPDFLKASFGDRIIPARTGAVRLEDHIDKVLSSTDDNPAPYLHGFQIQKVLPELLPDLKPGLRYGQPSRADSRLVPARLIRNILGKRTVVELLIGGRGTRFKLHYDVFHMDGFVSQIYGEKEFVLFSPDDDAYLYKNDNLSEIGYIDEVDLSRYPLFEKATPYATILRAGETIFNPSGWWHTTRLLSPSIAIVESSVGASAWRRFSEDISGWTKTPNRFRARLKLAYLRGAGVLMSAGETLGRWTHRAR